MLRHRPELCPYCAHDVRERLVCASCREPLPISGSLEERGAGESSYLTRERPLPRWVTPTVLGGLGVTLGLVFVWESAVYLFFALPIAALLFMLVQPSVARAVRAYRGERRPILVPDAELGASDEGELLVRGRVRAVLPASPSTSLAVWRGVAGRFWVETPEGRVLVDDDRVEVLTYECVADGDLVEVRGPAKRRADGLAFDGTNASPLRIRAL